MFTLRRVQPISNILAASALLLTSLLLAAGCNFNDPDVIRDNDTSDSDADVATDDAATDAGADADLDSQSDTGSDTDERDDVGDDTADDTDACQERAVADFCADNGAECGSLTTAGRCETMRTELCGTCSNNDTCIDNSCTCVSPWTGDGIDAAFLNDTRIYVMNLGFIWGYDPDTADWTDRMPLSAATTPIDFTGSPAVEGTFIWDQDGPTAAVATERATLFFNGSLYWLHDDRRDAWIASGDLNDPLQEDFQLDRGFQRNIFGDGTIEAGISEDRKTFFLINGDVFHEFELQDMSPVEIEQKTAQPLQLQELFPDQSFAGGPSRPWDRGMTWGAYSSDRLGALDFVVLGSENQSWIGPNNGPLEYEAVGPNSDVYAGAACTP